MRIEHREVAAIFLDLHLLLFFPLAARAEARAASFGLLDHRIERDQDRLAFDLRGRSGKPARRCDYDGLACR